MNDQKYQPVTRRTFMISTAAGIAAISSSARAVTSIRAGLIGCGEVGESLLRATYAHDIPLDILAVADTDSHRLAHLPSKLRTTTSWASLIDDKHLDALLIATPDHLHAAMAQAALVAGKHVYLVPPFAHTNQETQALYRIATKNSGRLHVAMDSAAQAHWARCKSAAERNQTGTPRWIQADLPCPPQRPQDHWSHVHACGQGDAACSLFSSLYPLIQTFDLGIPSQCSILGGVFESNGRETPDTLSISAEFEKGLRITLTTKRSATNTMPTVIRGRKGSIELPAPNGALHFDLVPWARSLHDGNPVQGRCLDAALFAHSVLCDALERRV